MDRWEIDLSVAHKKTDGFYIEKWRYLKVGYCDGDCKISFEGTGQQDPNEVDELTDIGGFCYLYIENDVQPGCSLVVYFEEEETIPAVNM